MKKWIIVIIIVSLILIGAGFYFYNVNTSNDNSEYDAERTSTDNSSNDEESKEQDTHVLTESEEISSFSTKIYTKDKNRQHNIGLTCSCLNDTDVENGATFSFCNTVGQSSPSRGYKKADIFTDGVKTKGYGGGNCQISTTLYNAVLSVPSLKVTERHKHSNKVPYIQKGKDAAVAYGSYDLKFVNNTGNPIRIKASNTPDAITITLVKLI